MTTTTKRWTKEAIKKLNEKPLLDLIYQAASIHRKYHRPNEVQISTLLSIKTGGCPEDCGYCPQAARYYTDIEENGLMSVQQVKARALRAKASGSSRLCMGAAWRNVREGKEFEHLLELVRAVNYLGLEVCCTLGMLTEDQARRLADAGLYAYNHNVDTSREYYKEVISTRGYDDRLKTIQNVRKSGLTVCSGGIIGMGESMDDRIGMLYTLANLESPPESVPINALVAVEGTPMESQEPVSTWDMVRMIALTRLVIPKAVVRLSAGRIEMSYEGQALCFLAGAGSIFAGDKLLTTPNPDINADIQLFNILGLKPKKAYTYPSKPKVKDSYGESQSNGEKARWSRPGHIIKRNVKAAEKGKRKRKPLEKAMTLRFNKLQKIIPQSNCDLKTK